MTDSIVGWGTTYPTAGAPTVGNVGSWTMQTSNTEFLGLLSSSSTGVAEQRS